MTEGKEGTQALGDVDVVKVKDAVLSAVVMKTNFFLYF